MLREFQFQDTEPRLLISLTISENRELSDIKRPILPYRPFKCLSVYSHECSLDLDKINLLKKSSKLPARILEPKSSKCIPSFHKCVYEILSLEIKPNPFNMHCFLKLSFTSRIRRVDAMFLTMNVFILNLGLRLYLF